jgi:hypothetical protein
VDQVSVGRSRHGPFERIVLVAATGKRAVALSVYRLGDLYAPHPRRGAGGRRARALAALSGGEFSFAAFVRSVLDPVRALPAAPLRIG